MQHSFNVVVAPATHEKKNNGPLESPYRDHTPVTKWSEETNRKGTHHRITTKCGVKLSAGLHDRRRQTDRKRVY